MTPVLLGDLASNQPAPTGLCQIKRGASDAQTVCPANNSIMYDGAGAPMQIAITPARPGWWIIRAETIFIIADAAWYYFAWYIQLSPADANGQSIDYGHHCLHNAVGWRQQAIDTAFRLNASTAYTATLYFRDRQAGTVYYWTGATYTYIAGEFIGEGSV
jgi:hypothetical protein